jgi:hypothetical protein
MKPLIWFVSLFLLLIVQAGVLLPLRLAPVNLILVMILVAVLLSDFGLGLGLTITGGLLLDFVSGAPDGLITMSLLGIFLLAYFVLNTLLSRDPNQVILFTTVAGGTAAYIIFFLLFNQFFKIFHLGTPVGVGYLFKVELPLSLLFNLIFTYPIFQYYQWVTHLQSKA